MLENNSPQRHEDRRSGYRVPDGYFNDLKQTIMTKAQMDEPQESWGSALRRIGGFALGFCAMVLISLGIIRLTPDSAERELMAQKAAVESEQSEEIELFTAMYDVTEDDIISYYYSEDDQTEREVALLAEIDDYLMNYGIGADFLGTDDLDLLL